ncbi:basic phospholipase A2 PA-9C-like [Scyliorhinus canicula]|uniref:basic phospholipase A2 PA-9C-like n=1 Tax=Scyliorhinus canicula TaxID=7830 RepID=UPI0018F6B57D|nr:basic phospholipase A2 PA-9C-like [Scyliorhinus canicula]
MIREGETRILQTSSSQRKQEPMEPPNLIALLILFTAMLIPVQSFEIRGRKMVDFPSVINCANPGANSLSYYNYGCFCGIGGNGNQPVDAIDRCCYLHDQCYGEAISMGCSIWTTLYISRCYDEVPMCSGPWLSWFPCSNKMCECDVAAALCFRKHIDKFNQTFVDYDQDLCQTIPGSSLQ